MCQSGVPSQARPLDERRKITWSELWNTESNMLSITIRATYDVLPSPTNLHLWFGKDPACLQCLGNSETHPGRLQDKPYAKQIHLATQPSAEGPGCYTGE